MSRLLSYLLIVLLAAAIGLIDLRILPYLQSSGMSSNIVVDVAACLGAGIAGLRLAIANGLPSWWRDRVERHPRWHLFLIAALGLFVILLTTALYFLSPPAGLPAWARSLTPDLAILLALRAGIGEEILFRLFFFSLIVWASRTIHAERGVSLIAGAILSALAFTLIHPGFYIPFVEGLALAVIYFEGGIAAAIAAHFFADAIPFLILALR